MDEEGEEDEEEEDEEEDEEAPASSFDSPISTTLSPSTNDRSRSTTCGTFHASPMLW
jgi:hypothetical protein